MPTKENSDAQPVEEEEEDDEVEATFLGDPSKLFNPKANSPNKVILRSSTNSLEKNLNLRNQGFQTILNTCFARFPKSDFFLYLIYYVNLHKRK